MQSFESAGDQAGGNPEQTSGGNAEGARAEEYRENGQVPSRRRGNPHGRRQCIQGRQTCVLFRSPLIARSWTSTPGKHTGIGSTKEKSKSLDMLKQKRQAKESRRVSRTSWTKRTAKSDDPFKANKNRDSESPAPRRQYSESGSSTSDDEEGQVHRPKLDDVASVDGTHPKVDDKLTLADLNKARITRDMLENQCMSERFDDYVKGTPILSASLVAANCLLAGGWVRLLIGMDQGETIYRLCEIVGE